MFCELLLMLMVAVVVVGVSGMAVSNGYTNTFANTAINSVLYSRGMSFLLSLCVRRISRKSGTLPREQEQHQQQRQLCGPNSIDAETCHGEGPPPRP